MECQKDNLISFILNADLTDKNKLFQATQNAQELQTLLIQEVDQSRMSDSQLQLAETACHKVTNAVFEMLRQTPQYQFADDQFLLEAWLSPFGHLLRAHANYCMIRFMEANKDPKVAKAQTTQDLINLLICWSKATLNEDTVFQMLPYEKDQLRKLIQDDKHHAVTAMNILMYFQRRSLLDIGGELLGG